VNVDMFLKLKNPDVTGEAADAEHKGEIEVVSWSWGLQSPRDVSTGRAAAKFKLNELLIVKRIDRSSPVLMQIAKYNKVVEQATLTLRKAGTTQLTFLTVELKNARVTAVNVQCENTVGHTSTDVVERVNFGFDHVTVTYTPQGSTGAKGGGDVTFEADAYSSDSR
jgi:type VI secretion system secreted protein Hcp